MSMILTCINPTSDILGDPQNPEMISHNDSQLLYGETFEVEKEHGAYVYGHSMHDGYTGYIDRGDLIKNGPEANAIITSRMAHLYQAPSFQSRPYMQLSIGSKLNLEDKPEDNFYKTYDGYWVYKDSLQFLKNYKAQDDLADIALKFFDTPYLYGGRSIYGVDCSGLVQMSIFLFNLTSQKRDSKDQRSTIGREIKKDQLKRNDIVFFEGHVGIMMDEENILNATSRHMTTLIEPLSDLEKAYDRILSIRRL
ncbi:MAG: NlpC/P60 family protein [Pseudomonadota bacterium]